MTKVADGATVTERYVPVDRAGVYVPGGLVAYPSSVVMNVIPAQVAGVAEIAVASPPQPEHGGLPHPAVLAACALLGITEVHAAGRRPGDRDARLRHGGLRARRHHQRAGQRLRGCRQAAAARPGRDRRRGRPDRGRDHRGRLGRPGVGGRRPGRAGRARLAGRLPADHHRSRARRPGRQRADRAGRRRPGTGSGSRRPWPASPPACSWTTPTPRWRSRTPGPPSTWRSRPNGADRARLAGPQRRRGVRRAVLAGVPRRLPGRLQPRAAHRRDRAALRRALGADLPARHPRGGVRRRRARRGRAVHRRARRGRGPGRARERGPRASAQMSATVSRVVIAPKPFPDPGCCTV